MNQGATQPNLNTNLVKDIKLPLPSVREQKRIIEWLDRHIVGVQRCIDLQMQQIVKLKEYKTTLINSAVTGKIKVTEEMTGAQDAIQA